MPPSTSKETNVRFDVLMLFMLHIYVETGRFVSFEVLSGIR